MMTQALTAVLYVLNTSSYEHLLTTTILTGGLIFYWFKIAKFYKLLYFKPFNCEPCLAFWVALLVYFIPTQYQLPLICATYSIFVYIILKDKYDGNTT